MEFFLEAVQRQALANTRRVKGILELYDKMKIAVSEITRSQYSPAILDAIFDRPIFKTSDFISRSQIPKPTAATAVRKLREAGILVAIQESRGKLAATLAFRDLVNQAEGREIL